MKILFASAEIYPYAKTGGLADVAQALPAVLNETTDLISVMPMYDFIDKKQHDINPLLETLVIEIGEEPHDISLYEGYNRGVRTLFVYNDILCTCTAPYGDENGDYPRNDLRFALFSKALIRLAELYSIELLHLNDWHTALAALWARESKPDLKVVFTIHNLAYQGLFPEQTCRVLDIDPTCFTPDGIEFWGQLNCMKAGIAYSDRVTTVSPTYAREILDPEFGCGLEGFLQVHAHKLSGILNGIDTVLFDPQTDPSLKQNYSAEDLSLNRSNKVLMCQQSGFKDPERPFFIFIGRFTEQKGLDIIIEALPKILQMPLNLTILGEGDKRFSLALEFESQHRDNLSVTLGYDESLSHRLYSAADFLLMPSRFEPCGLNQMISLRYGTLPIIHDVGGLHDSIKHYTDQDASVCGNGIVIDTLDKTSLAEAIREAMRLYEQKDRYRELCIANMQCDVSFEKSATAYLNLYKEIL